MFLVMAPTSGSCRPSPLDRRRPAAETAGAAAGRRPTTRATRQPRMHTGQRQEMRERVNAQRALAAAVDARASSLRTAPHRTAPPEPRRVLDGRAGLSASP